MANGSRFAIIDSAGQCQLHASHRSARLPIVMSGEIEMHMDQSVVKLKAGDVVVERDTITPRRTGSQPARIAVILIDGETLNIGKRCRGRW